MGQSLRIATRGLLGMGGATSLAIASDGLLPGIGHNNPPKTGTDRDPLPHHTLADRGTSDIRFADRGFDASRSLTDHDLPERRQLTERRLPKHRIE